MRRRPIGTPVYTLPDRAIDRVRRSPSFTATAQLRSVLSQSWVTIVLLPITPPAAIAINYYHGPSGPILTIALNFVALIPLGSVLELVTKELIIRRGPHVGMTLIVTLRFVSKIATQR